MNASVWQATKLNRTGAVIILIAAGAVGAQALLLLAASDDVIISVVRNATIAEREKLKKTGSSSFYILTDAEIDARLANNRQRVIDAWKKETTSLPYAKLVAAALFLSVGLGIFLNSRFVVRILGIITGLLGALSVVLQLPKFGEILSLLTNARLDAVLLLDATSTFLIPLSVVFVWIAVSGAGWTETRPSAPPPPPPVPLPPRL